MKNKDNVNVVFPAAGENSRGELPANLVAEAARINAIIAVNCAVRDAEESRRMRNADVTTNAAAFARFEEYFTDPRAAAKSKAQFVNMLQQLVADRDTKHWIFGFAADLFLVHGSLDNDDAARIRDEMSVFLADLRSAREREAREGQKPRPHGRWFNKTIHAIAERYGVTTPRQRKPTAANAF
jgi:hypothetical protein